MTAVTDMALFHRAGHMVRSLIEGRLRFEDTLPEFVRIEILMPGEKNLHTFAFDVHESGRISGRDVTP